MPTAYDTEIDLDSPTAHWKLNETSGNLIDRKTGRVAGLNGTWTYSQPGLLPAGNGADTAVYFSAGYASSLNATALISATAFSVELWVKPAALPTSGVRSAMLKGDAVTFWTYGIDVTTGGTFQFYIQRTAQYTYTTLTGGTVIPGSLAHVVGTYDGANIRLYVNGSLAAAPAAAVLFSTGSTEDDAPFVIDRVEPANQLDAVIDEVAYYPSALADGRIRSHYEVAVQQALASGHHIGF